MGVEMKLFNTTIMILDLDILLIFTFMIKILFL